MATRIVHGTLPGPAPVNTPFLYGPKSLGPQPTKCVFCTLLDTQCLIRTRGWKCTISEKYYLESLRENKHFGENFK